MFGKRVALTFIITSMSSLFVAAGCASKTDTQSLAYEMSHNGCTTGHHDFTNAQTMCAALQDENFNNECAQNEREGYFKQNCPGTFTPALKSYTFGDQGCDTGRHGFNSDAELCKALQNETLNLHCAAAERESYFKQVCNGGFRKGPNAGHKDAANDGPSPVLSNLDCHGYYISGESGVKPIAWSARDLNENVFPTVPEHSSIVLTCTQLNSN